MPSVKLVKVTGHSRGSLSVGCRSFLLVEPLLDETEERLWLAPEQLRVIFTSEQLIVKFALHQLIIELAPLALGLSGGAWGRPAVAVTTSTSELPDSTSDGAHATEGLTFVELFIKFALEEVIVELASLTLGLSGGAWGRSAVAVTASTSEFPDSSSDGAHATEGFTFVEFLIELALEELIVELAPLTLSLSGSAWGRPTVAVTASTSEFPDSSSDRTHASEGFTFVELLIKFTLFEIEIKASAVCAGEFIVIAGNKRILGLKTVGNSRGDGGSSDEDGSGDFHLDHDEMLNVLD